MKYNDEAYTNEIQTEEKFNLSLMKSIMKNNNAGRNAFIQGFILFFQGWIISGFADRANLKSDPHPNEFVFNNVHIILDFLLLKIIYKGIYTLMFLLYVRSLFRQILF